MAPRTGILLLIGLCVFIYTVKSCAVICSTDYKTLLNCSCSDREPSDTLLLRVICRFDDLKLNESCRVSVQQPYCVMYPNIMEEIADVETVCSAVAFRAWDHTLINKESSNWQLRLAVRPWPPLNISVEMTKTSYKITWMNENLQHCLKFRVRLRTRHDTEKPEIMVESEQSFVQLEQVMVPPGVCYRVDVQAKVCPGSYEGPWSEWSIPILWTTAAVEQQSGTKHYYWLITLPILIFLSLGFPKVMLWHKKLKMMTYIPKPGEFFKPLDNIHQGNFKAWVKPLFAEHNFQVYSGADMKLDHGNQALPSPDSNVAYSPVHISLVSFSTFTNASNCFVTSDYSHEGGSVPCELEKHAQKRPPLNLSTLSVVHDVDEEELSGSDYPLMDLDTIDSGFVECSSPPVTSQLLCQHCETDLGPATQQLFHHTNYVKQWTMSEAVDDSPQQNGHTGVGL